MKKLHLIGKLLAIGLILFLSLFALDTPLGIGLLIHLVPSLILIIILVLAWKKPIFGSLYILVGLAFTIFFNTYRQPITFLTISGIPILTGVIFTLAAKFSKQK